MLSQESLPILSVSAMRAVAFCLLGACASPQALPVPPHPVDGGVEFSLVLSDAQSVAVAGNFNEWSHAAHPLERGDGGRWSCVVPLPEGEHMFMFVIDGDQWMSPPLADDFVEDGFGQRNGVVVVKGK